MPDYIIKRDGSKVKFDEKKIAEAVWKAAQSVDGQNKEMSSETAKIISLKINERFKEEIPTVEEVQDVVEETLIKEGHDKTAKSYIRYRFQRELARQTENLLNDHAFIEEYVTKEDWTVRENSNMSYSLQGLNNHLSSKLISNYWLNKLYPKEIGDAHKNAELHIHDLSSLSVYCVGWDLKQLLIEGFTGVRGKISSKPAKHLRSALGQIVNYFYTLQGESAGAQAFSNFDTLLAPFIRYDGLTKKEVKQAMQEFLFNCNVPTRVGFQTPFTNITMDLVIPSNLKNMPVILGGKPMEATYSDFQDEMDLFNEVFAEVMTEGDSRGRLFTFPIPTYNITPEFDWETPKYDKIWEMTAKYGIPYFANFVNSDMSAEDARSMCCRLRLDNRELNKRGGGLFGSSPMTGSIGVVTINMPRIGFLAKSEEDYFEKLAKIMDMAKKSLILKRKTLEELTTNGLYPYSMFYLRGMKETTGEYWKNHFSTIGLMGMNESVINFLGKNLASEEGHKFSVKVLKFMRNRLSDYQEETGDLFNLEATPGEGTSHRLARTDKKQFPSIQVANESVLKEGTPPYYTNSTQLPVNYTVDLFEAMNKQDELQCLYTGGTVFHVFLGERISSIQATKNLVKKLSNNYRMPYFSLTPTFSICPIHGYIDGEHEYCPMCEKESDVKSEVKA